MLMGIDIVLRLKARAKEILSVFEVGIVILFS